MANSAASNGEKLDQIFALLADLSGRFDTHVEFTNKRFSDIDKRLGNMDKRLTDMKQE